MLYLMRKVGESVVINNDIEIQVVEIKGGSVKIGFVFPPSASVLRKEVHDKVMAENRAAATSSTDADDFFTAILKEQGRDGKQKNDD